MYPAIDLTPPPLSGKHVLLFAPTPSDYDWIYRLASSEDVTHRWRFGGLLPSPATFETVLWQGCDVQFGMRSIEHDRPIGLVQLMNYSARHGHGSLSVLIEPTLLRRGWPLEGVLLFINYVFRTLPLRKLYFESLEPIFESYRSAVGEFLVEEGRLRAHEFFNGRYHDLIVTALHREVWSEQIDRLLPIAQSDPTGY